MTERLPSGQWRSGLLVTATAAALYVIGGMLIMLPFHNELTTFFWPPVGFAFAALWWFGKRAVAGVLLGALLVSSIWLSSYQPGHIALAAAAPIVEALVAVSWLRRQGVSDIFADAESIFRFIVIAVLVAPVAGACLGVGSLWLNGLLPSAALPQSWLAWWLGDSMGVLLVSPFLLALADFRKAALPAARLPELAVMTMLLGWLWVQLFTALPTLNLPPLSFAAIPLIIWVAVRFPVGVLATVLFAASLFAIYGTSAGHGPFVRETLQESIAYLYGYLWTLASIGLFLGVAIASNRRTMDDLSREHLALLASEKGLRKTLENTPNVAVQWYDRNGRVLYWNSASERLYGWRSDEALGKTLDQLIQTPEEARQFETSLKEIAATGKTIGPVETKVRHRDGRGGMVMATIFALPDAEGDSQRFVCMDVDINKLKQAEEALRTSNTHLAEAQRIARLGSWERDFRADRYISSEEARRIVGLTSADPHTSFAMVQKMIHPDDREAHRNAWEFACTFPNRWYDLEYRLVRPDGALRHIRSQAEIIYDEHQQPVRAIGVLKDITEQKQAQAEIERLAYYDELTGLPNQRLMRLRLEQAMGDAQIEHKHMALLFVDIDHFKVLNDTHGHEAGDRLLRLAAERIQGCLDKEATVARPGGDEFGIILPGLAGSAEYVTSATMATAERIRDVLTMPFDLGDHVYHSSASIGAVIYPDELAQSSMNDLLKQVDTALFHAKDAGRNAICFFEAHMQDTVTKRLAIEQDLREALKREEFQLHLQPQTDREGRIIGAECLLRWQHPQRGLVSPAVFIPVAESTGLIVVIGKWVLYQACAIIARLEAAGQRVRISVNVSPRQFRQHDFVSQVKECLEQTGAEPQRLVVEITESVLMENVSDVIVRMTELVRVGVGFSIDDFGTGYSSLAYLKHLPLRELKIDKSFVDGLPRDQDDGSIVGSILALAQNLNLEVVAEGIETDEQLEYLKARGCQVFQGYLLGRPVVGEELIKELLGR